MHNWRKLIPYAVMVLVVAGAAAAIMWMRVQEPKERAAEQEAVKQAEQWRISVNEAELDLLARVAHEAGEPYEGQVAVAAVIINRVQHPEFPNTIAGQFANPGFQVVANGQVNKPADEGPSGQPMMP